MSHSNDAARPSIDSLVDQWRNGLRISHIAHSRSAATCELRGRMLGVAVVVLSAVVGTAIFSTVESSPNTALKVVAGLLSVVAGVLAALQTFLGFDQRASKHRELAAAYGALRRELEAATAFHPDASQSQQLLRDVRERWDALDSGAPATSQRIRNAATHAVIGAAGEREPAPREA